MDGRLPGLSGTETLAALRGEFPDARVLMLSIDDGEEDVHRALQAGAAGCLPKAVQLQDDRTEATRVAMERDILHIEQRTACVLL